MTAGGGPQRRGARTREALQAAALRLFAEKGYHSTTVSEITAAAGVTERAFFLHYPSKEDVLFNVEADEIALLERCVMSSPSNGDDMAVLEDAILTWNAQVTGTDRGRHQMTCLLLCAARSSATLRGKQLDYSETLAAAAAHALAVRHHGGAEASATAAEQTAADVAIRMLYLAIADWAEAAPDDLRRLTVERFRLLREAIQRRPATAAVRPGGAVAHRRDEPGPLSPGGGS